MFSNLRNYCFFAEKLGNSRSLNTSVNKPSRTKGKPKQRLKPVKTAAKHETGKELLAVDNFSL